MLLFQVSDTGETNYFQCFSLEKGHLEDFSVKIHKSGRMSIGTESP